MKKICALTVLFFGATSAAFSQQYDWANIGSHPDGTVQTCWPTAIYLVVRVNGVPVDSNRIYWGMGNNEYNYYSYYGSTDTNYIAREFRGWYQAIVKELSGKMVENLLPPKFSQPNLIPWNYDSWGEPTTDAMGKLFTPFKNGLDILPPAPLHALEVNVFVRPKGEIQQEIQPKTVLESLGISVRRLPPIFKSGTKTTFMVKVVATTKVKNLGSSAPIEYRVKFPVREGHWSNSVEREISERNSSFTTPGFQQQKKQFVAKDLSSIRDPAIKELFATMSSPMMAW